MVELTQRTLREAELLWHRHQAGHHGTPGNHDIAPVDVAQGAFGEDVKVVLELRYRRNHGGGTIGFAVFGVQGQDIFVLELRRFRVQVASTNAGIRRPGAVIERDQVQIIILYGRVRGFLGKDPAQNRIIFDVRFDQVANGGIGLGLDVLQEIPMFDGDGGQSRHGALGYRGMDVCRTGSTASRCYSQQWAKTEKTRMDNMSQGHVQV